MVDNLTQLINVSSGESKNTFTALEVPAATIGARVPYLKQVDQLSHTDCGATSIFDCATRY